VITYSFCWKRFKPKMDLSLGPTNVEFWVLAITFSIPLISIYRGVSSLLGHPRLFPEVFGFSDILILWIASLMIGVLGWISVLGIRQYLNRKTPLPEDSPMSIIHKLELNYSGFNLLQVDVGSNRYLLFPPVSGTSGKNWILPFIEYEFKPKATSGFKKEFNKIVDRIDGERTINTPEGSHDLYLILKEGLAKKMLIVNWANEERPTLVEDSKIKRLEKISLLKGKDLT
jgi:hypothetical protein